MAIRTVRLDEEGEATLRQIREATGLPISEAFAASDSNCPSALSGLGYVPMAVAGSVIGTILLDLVCRKEGEAGLEK